MGSVIRLVVLLVAIAVGVRFAPTLLARYTEQRSASLEETAEPGTGAASHDALSAEAEPDFAAREPAPATERTYYRYMDAGGSLHFVDSLERVPEAFRASARPLSMDASKQGGAPQLTRAEARAPKRRPFAEAAPPAARAPSATARGPSAGVVVYTTSWCGWCRKTIAWLDTQGVEYENRDIEKNPAWRDELIEKTGGTSIPVVEIDGELIRGYSPGRMGELL